MPELSSLETLIARYGLRSKKSLGQHFLLDTHLCEQIAALAGNLEGIHAVEIGPGPGGLTRALLTSNAASVTVIEKDSRVLPALQHLLDHAPQRLHIIEGDALTISPLSVAPAPRAIIANLPYNVGTELLLHWLEEIATDPQQYQSLTLMFQKEVGARLTAQPGSKSYGRLSVLTQWLCETALLMDIPPEAFSPPPKVESVVVQLIPRPAPLYPADKARLEQVLSVAFQQRRKMLRSALKPLALTNTLAELGIAETRRDDELTLAEFSLLANKVRK